MKVLSFSVGIALILVVLLDAFETLILTRRVRRRFRLVRFFYKYTWRTWSSIASVLPAGRTKENFLAFYGPFSLLILISFWAIMLVGGFSLLYWSIPGSIHFQGGQTGFGSYLYFSGTTFFTLGLGDTVPGLAIARAIAVVESGMGFGFLAIVISYLPGLNQSFSRREVNISLLGTRAGSPPTAAAILFRHIQGGNIEPLRELLKEWERWSAQLLETHLSYPVLAFFRSQHENQSWLASITAILDTGAFAMAGLAGICEQQAEMTFDLARHAVMDLVFVFGLKPRKPRRDRLPMAELEKFSNELSARGLALRNAAETDQRLSELRRRYEPLVFALSDHFLLPIPAWILGERDYALRGTCVTIEPSEPGPTGWFEEKHL